MIKAIHNESQLVIGNMPQVGLLGQILTDQAVDLLIQAALPSLVRFGEVDLGLKFTGNGFMSGKLPTVIRSDRVNPLAMRPHLLKHMSQAE